MHETYLDTPRSIGLNDDVSFHIPQNGDKPEAVSLYIRYPSGIEYPVVGDTQGDVMALSLDSSYGIGESKSLSEPFWETLALNFTRAELEGKYVADDWHAFAPDEGLTQSEYRVLESLTQLLARETRTPEMLLLCSHALQEHPEVGDVDNIVSTELQRFDTERELSTDTLSGFTVAEFPFKPDSTEREVLADKYGGTADDYETFHGASAIAIQFGEVTLPIVYTNEYYRTPVYATTESRLEGEFDMGTIAPVYLRQIKQTVLNEVPIDSYVESNSHRIQESDIAPLHWKLLFKSALPFHPDHPAESPPAELWYLIDHCEFLTEDPAITYEQVYSAIQ